MGGMKLRGLANAFENRFKIHEDLGIWKLLHLGKKAKHDVRMS